MTSIIEQIFRFGAENPEKIALVEGKNCITYGEMLKSIVFAKGILTEMYDLHKGDRVILAADKQMEFVSVYFACHLLEVVTLPIAPDTNAKRYELIKSKMKPNLIVGFQDDSQEKQMVRLDAFSGLMSVPDLDDITFPQMDCVADIIFTTGTTGEPKGVQLSHRNIVAAARNINMFIANTPDDVEMLALPISHSFGLGLSLIHI